MNVDYTRGEGNRGTGLVAIKTGCAMLGLRIHPWGLLSLLAVTLSLYERYQKKRRYETKYQVAVKESIVDTVFLPKLSCVSRCIDIHSLQFQVSKRCELSWRMCQESRHMIVRSPEDDSVDVGDNGGVGGLLYWMVDYYIG